MKITNKNDLITVIDKSAEELHQRIDMHLYLMATILEQRVGEGNLTDFSFSSYSPQEKRLKKAIKETIEVLEQTKKAFKSKRLEILRNKLIQVLTETD